LQRKGKRLRMLPAALPSAAGKRTKVQPSTFRKRMGIRGKKKKKSRLP